MHVALIGSHPFPGEPSKGGVQRVVQVLRRELASKVRVSLIVPSVFRSLRHADEFGEAVYLKRPPGPGFLSYWSWVSRDVYQEVERLRPDVVHVQDVAGLVRFWPDRSKSLNCPMIFTAHGVLETDILLTAEKDPLRRVTASARAAVVGAVERTSRALYDEVIVINEYVLEAMPDIAGLRHHLIPNPVDEVFLGPPRDTPLRGGSFHLLQVGMVSPLKNIAASIAIVHELVRRNVKVHLHVLGPVADERYHRYCLGEIEKRHLESAVTFHGSVVASQVAAWMDRADALLLTSKQEVAPMVVAEAHCRGLPVAVPRAFGLRSMVAEGVNGVFLDGPSPSDDARRVGELLMSGVDRNAIRQDASTRYELGSVVNRTLGVYRQALDTRPMNVSKLAFAGT